LRLASADERRNELDQRVVLGAREIVGDVVVGEDHVEMPDQLAVLLLRRRVAVAVVGDHRAIRDFRLAELIGRHRALRQIPRAEIAPLHRAELRERVRRDPVERAVRSRACRGVMRFPCYAAPTVHEVLREERGLIVAESVEKFGRKFSLTTTPAPDERARRR
jgi:hypothetical protein